MQKKVLLQVETEKKFNLVVHFLATKYPKQFDLNFKLIFFKEYS